MDLLKAELERKRRGIAQQSSTNIKGGGAKDGFDHNGKRKKKQYLTAAQRRRLEEKEEEERDEEEERIRRDKKRGKKRRRRRRGDDDERSDNDEEGGGETTEDLTTMLTKRYDPKERLRKSQAAAAAAAAAEEAASKTNNANDETAGTVGDNGNTASRKEQSKTGKDGSVVIPDSLQKLSPREVTDALRRYGLPVRLFGERTLSLDAADSETRDDAARLRRLFAADQGREAAMLGESERDEFRLDSANRTRNVFLEKDNNNEDARDNNEGGESEKKKSKSVAEMTEEERNDKPKRIYRYFKDLLKNWEEDLALRPEAIKRTAAGKNETKTLKQCKDYIRPLFSLCRRRELEEALQLHLFNIVTHCEEGEFVKAHDSYMDMAIGRAAWPIGVTMVGIHARSGRAKIESSNVAHVMNSELQRKYVTSVKRLMSYAQRKRPDVHPSKKVMNL